MKDNCLLCDGGQVHLHVSGQFVETIQCPDCNGTGMVDLQTARDQEDSIQACRKAESKVRLV